MTVCIGVLCERRSTVILVADRMITTGLSIEFEHPVRNKVTHLSENCLALTAGNALAYTELFTEVRQRTANSIFTSVEQFVEVIKACYQELRRKQIVERILLPRGFPGFLEFYQAQAAGLSDNLAFPIVGEIDRFKYGLEILVGGVSPGGGHLYVVDDPGTSYCLDSLGFHVIGSGTNLAASTLIASQCHHELSLPEAILVALQAKITSENAPGVGNRTDISLILPTQDGSAVSHQFNDDEIKKLRELCRAKREGDDTSVEQVGQMLSQKFDGNSGVTGSSQSATISAGDKHENGDSENTDGSAASRVVPATDAVQAEGSNGQGGANGQGVQVQA